MHTKEGGSGVRRSKARSALAFLAPCVAASFLAAPPASAQTGVSDDRVNLPEGPGSLQGIGDNATVSNFTGSMSYDVPIDVPDGFDGLTPQLSIAYSSTGGSGIVGIGWDMAVPYIERMTNLGLPSYDADDRFVADGGTQLVRVDDGEPATYRARFEKGFARYRWHGVGDGTGGWWTAELPDGIVRYYGADHEGNLDHDALVSGPSGVFRYHLVEVTDPFGHVAKYHYTVLDSLPYLDSVEYTFTHGQAKSRVAFTYEQRPDLLSDARSGFNEVRTQRLSGVDVFSSGTKIWHYGLTYEPVAKSGGLSRLQQVQRLGVNGTPDPVLLGFEYSKTLANDCGGDCAQPYLVDMGNLGTSLQNGEATLIDINGDTLPDVLDTSVDGPHRFFLNQLTADGHQGFSAAVQSHMGTRNSHELSSPYVQVLDLNGDGLTDIINSRTGEALFNDGSGDWVQEGVVGDANLPDFGDDFAGGGAELAHVRFFDYDNDRKIDVLFSEAQETEIYANEGDAGFQPVQGVDSIGFGFADTDMELDDMNGDGLQDVVVIRPGEISYRLNLGHGHWAGWQNIENLPFNEAEMQYVSIEDINGDSISDLVLVLGNEVRFAINRNGTEFQSPQTLRMVQNGAIPTRDGNTTVLFADMDGNGSDDIVWVDGQGHVQYLEMFPVRPNLLARVTNGLGMVTDVTYTTSVQQQIADSDPWTHKLPFAMQLVASQDTYELINQQHDLTSYRYHQPYYDGLDKQFRGFAKVEVTEAGDDTQRGSVRTETYDVGDQDRYRAGLLLSTKIEETDGDQRIPLESTSTTYADCTVAGIPEHLDPAVRFVCPTATERVEQEGASQDQWVTTRTEMTYDGYGNVTLQSDLGVAAIGGAACGACQNADGAFGAACGPHCDGDEMYTETAFVPPEATEGRWMIHKPYRLRSYAAEGGVFTEADTWYDGDSFVGLPAGHLTLGLVTRTTQRVDDQKTIATGRFAYDAHGNEVESLDPRGAPGMAGFRTRKTYDDDGLLVVREEQELLDGNGQTYVLRRETTYDPVQGKPSVQTNWVTVIDGQVQGTPQEQRFAYDDLGRLSAATLPGDTLQTPTTAFTYEYGSPVSRIITRQRSQSGHDADQELVACYDGLGRMFQKRAKVDDSHFEVSGFTVFNRRGAPVRTYRPYIASGDQCDMAQPQDVPYSESVYDGLDREIVARHPDASIYGQASVKQTLFGPLTRTVMDVEDNDTQSPFHDTPLVQHFDGMGRLVAAEYVLQPGQPGLVYKYDFDGMGNLRGLTDPAGNVRTQTWDAAHRIVAVQDPDRGRTTFEYDDAGHLTRTTDAAGRKTRSAYDALGRLSAQWDEDDEDGTTVRFLFDDASGCPDDVCANTGGMLVGVQYPTDRGTAQAWYGYDARQRPAKVARVIDGVRFDFGMEYDNLERQTAEVLPDGTRLAYGLDGLGRLTAVDGYIDQIQYARGKLPSSSTLHNGVHETWEYDDLDRKTHRVVQGADGSGWVDLTYTYSRAGLLDQIEDASDDHDGPGLGATFDYDALYRLTGAVLDPGKPAEETLAFQYDAAQNLVQKTSSLGAASRSHVGALRYGEDGAGPHAVTHAGDLAMTYDAAGFVTQRGDVSLAWDYRGRLSDVSNGDDMIAHYVYGPDEQRVISREGAHFTYHLAPTFEIEDGMALAYVTVANQRRVVIESDALAAKVLSDVAPATDNGGTLTVDADDAIDAGDAVVAARVAAGEAHLAQDVTLSPVAELLMASARRTLLDGQKRVTYNHFDAAGNLVAISDAQGKLLERRAYDPYGLQRTFDEGETAYGFSGKRTDRSTGLTFFGERYYDATVGRWTAPDFMFRTLNGDAVDRPWEAVGSYVFNLNNPIAFRDMTGANGGDDDAQPNPNSESQVVISQINNSQENGSFGLSEASRLEQANVESQSEAFNIPDDNFMGDLVNLAVQYNKAYQSAKEWEGALQQAKDNLKEMDTPQMREQFGSSHAAYRHLDAQNVAWRQHMVDSYRSKMTNIRQQLGNLRSGFNVRRAWHRNVANKLSSWLGNRSRNTQRKGLAKAKSVLGGIHEHDHAMQNHEHAMSTVVGNLHSMQHL